MAPIVVVCTGNVCRSPMAEGFLRAAIAVRFGSAGPAVASAGTMGWEGSGADPLSVAAAAEHGIDVSAHVARRLTVGMVAEADLVLAMAREHAVAVATAVPEVAPKTFTLKELVRLLEALPQPGPSVSLSARVSEANALRWRGLGSADLDDDVDDPLGMPLAAFRVVAEELEGWCARLAAGLFGPAQARAGTAGA